jgi:hypothetical protein
MIMYSWDPGKSTGWCRFEENCLHSFGTTQLDSLGLMLQGIQEARVFVIESYFVRPKSAGGFDHNWSAPVALEAIGAIKSRAQQIGAEIVMQQASLKVPGYGFAGMVYKKGQKNRHHLDALAHGAYYLVKQKLIQPGSLQIAQA